MAGAISIKSSKELIEKYSFDIKSFVYNHLAQAADDVKLGRVQDMDVAFDEILKELNDYELST